MSKTKLNDVETFNREIKAMQAKANSTFPLDALPVEYQEFIIEAYNKKAIPPDFMSGALLTAFSTAAGKRFSISAFGHQNYPCLWTALVGESGTNKSEPISLAFEPIREIDRQLFKKYQIDLAEYNEYQELSSKEKKQKPRVPLPLLKQHIVDDITFEKLYDMLNANPSGICSYNDELMSWIADLERYGNPSTQSKYISIWSFHDTNYHRKKQNLKIENPFVSKVGGVQTDLIKDLAGERRSQDGTLYRFLFCFPDRVKQGKATGSMDVSIVNKYNDGINKLINYQYIDFANDITQHNSVLSTDAKEEFDVFMCDLRNKLNSLDESFERKFIAKLQIYLHRITLLMHTMKFASSTDENPNKEIDIDSVKSAIKIVNYFKAGSDKVGSIVGDHQNGTSAKDVAIWLRKNNPDLTYKDINKLTNLEYSKQWYTNKKQN